MFLFNFQEHNDDYLHENNPVCSTPDRKVALLCFTNYSHIVNYLEC